MRVRTRGEHDEAVIEVQNEGVPIPPADIPRLFQPFERGAGAATADHGVGLGLFISKEIVAAHRGTIGVRSTPEEGTVFTVRLPATCSPGVGRVSIRQDQPSRHPYGSSAWWSRRLGS